MKNLEQKNLAKYDYFIFGCGLSGATLANKLINENPNKKILIFELRPQIGGNIYDFKDQNGIIIHKYGPHIFHSSNDKVINFVKSFSKWKEFRHRVNVKIEEEEVPLPINFKSIDILFSLKKEEIKEALIKEFNGAKNTFIFNLLNSKNNLIKDFGNFIYKNVFENYSTKMWGQNPLNLDKDILKRVPIILSYDDGYFNDKFQAVPDNGYTEFLKKIIDNKNIKVILNTDFNILKIINNKTYILNEEIKKPIIYTGMIDKLFNYKFGKLDYRSINFQFETVKVDSFQKRAITNYPADEKMTRITEYKKLSQQNLEKLRGITTIGKEYPGKFDENSKEFNIPCYPIYTKKELENHKKYINEAKKINNLYLLGRLAEYKYKQMTQTVDDALNLEIK
ncbi:/ rfbD / putative UDP-galactopyranose mutase /:439595 Forward [Candidatus Hepatoplasma crinochetorum]|uniref:/ rfbD / putative UDP-galactopyranose mutase /:439595 Forward n=1 Tax=Candidatus Hepatoplasma crinochetorum TaxID=295596 RepID=A0A0G7ZL99_9MOLU|nr:/ rfbD / putative UDP-galactopyranose mutase /:439595 Forward [Candidatus Hepatoplasma crinochetorum]